MFLNSIGANYKCESNEIHVCYFCLQPNSLYFICSDRNFYVAVRIMFLFKLPHKLNNIFRKKLHSLKETSLHFEAFPQTSGYILIWIEIIRKDKNLIRKDKQ